MIIHVKNLFGKTFKIINSLYIFLLSLTCSQKHLNHCSHLRYFVLRMVHIETKVFCLSYISWRSFFEISLSICLYTIYSYCVYYVFKIFHFVIIRPVSRPYIVFLLYMDRILMYKLYDAWRSVYTFNIVKDWWETKHIRPS